MVIRRMNEAHADEDERQDGCDLQQHHDVVGLGRFTNAAHQHHRQEQDDQKCRNVEAEVPARVVENVALESR